MRHPLVAGVAGGVGTTTVATAVAATDCGICRAGQPVDAVVCRDTVVSLGAAHRAVNAAVGKPLLVVVASTSNSTPKAASARIEMVKPHVATVVHVPFVMRWREVTDPWAQAANVLRYPDSVPKWLRPFAQSMQQLYDALLAQLHSTQNVAAPASPPVGTQAPVVPKPFPFSSS